MTWLMITVAGLAGLGILAIAFGALRGSRTRDAESGEPLPPTALQKRAWIALVSGVLATVLLVAVFAIGGFERYDRSAGMRVLVYALLGAGVSVHALVVPRTVTGAPRRWADERDLRVFERAPAIQGAAVLIVLAAWAIGLTESYRASGAIPLVFPSLIFLSAFFVHLVSISFAILLGYRHGVEDA